MRYFKLENSVGDTVDITTDKILFHDIEGLGFEEETDFRSVGPVWRLNNSSLTQLPVTGKICFTEFGNTTPYEKYEQFKAFISRAPLNLIYYPHGLGGSDFRKKVRVTRLVKTELTKYGVLDNEISFTPFTPWYKVEFYENVPDAIDENAHWIWDVGNEWRDSDDGDDTTPRYKFGGESRNIINIDCATNTQGFVKLTINGPAVNPTWTQYVNGGLKASGGFDSTSSFTLSSDERLIIDNTEGLFSMTVYNRTTGDSRNVYPLRDFDKQCFFNLEEGYNSFAVASEDGTPVSISLEGHIHYATV